MTGLACTGVVEDDARLDSLPTQGIDDMPVSGATGVVDTPTGTAGPAEANEAVRAADQAMNAADPMLFDLASHYFPATLGRGGKPRLFRLTRTQLDRTTSQLLPDAYGESFETTLPADPLQTNYEYADNLSWNAANFTPYVQAVAALAERVRAAPASVVDCGAEGDAPTCLDRSARAFVARAFRGVAQEAQLTRFAEFFKESALTVGLPQATADLVDVTLTSPSYVFREEVLTDSNGWLLAAAQLQNVTYTLADVPPEALGFSPEDAASLVGTPEALAATVSQVLQTPAARDKLVRFFLAWLEVREPDAFTIAPEVFPEFTPEVAAAIVDETRHFLEDRLVAAAPRLVDLTQSTESFVSDTIEFIYDQNAAADGGLVALDPNERLGLFTQPAVLASHSGPDNTRLVKRGVFFTRKVMCLALGAPPAGVDTTLPTMPGASERERVESVTAMQPCLGCHSFINPFGFMQESYDAIGRFRTEDENGLPIDPSIAVTFLDEGPVQTKTSVQALRTFTNSARFKQCFARQLFRFYLGRDESEGDDPVLRQMFFEFAHEDAQDIVAMLGTLAGSTSFATRTEAP